MGPSTPFGGFPGPPNGLRQTTEALATISTEEASRQYRFSADVRTKQSPPELIPMSARRTVVHMLGRATKALPGRPDGLPPAQDASESYTAVAKRRSAIWIPFSAAPFRRLSPHANSCSESS